MVVLRKEFKTLDVRYRHDSSYRYTLYDPYDDIMYENVCWDFARKAFIAYYEYADGEGGYGIFTDADLSNCEISRMEHHEWVEITFSL